MKTPAVVADFHIGDGVGLETNAYPPNLILGLPRGCLFSLAET
jgi:hypothetical protein